MSLFTLSWGPFYWVRRLWCFFAGHDLSLDRSTPEYVIYCRRCMRDYP